MWTNPKRINLDSPFVYHISITDDIGRKFQYIGGTTQGVKRFEKYKTNMCRIRDRKPHASNRKKYRAVHFVLYKAIENRWQIEFFPLEACSEGELNDVESRLIKAFGCNLNGERTWRIEDIDTLKIEDVVPNV